MGFDTELTTRARPAIADSAWVAPSADVIGDVELAEHASFWYGCVLRGDIAPIRVGAHTNIQDLTTVHVDEGRPCRIGDRVGIGHRAIVHGCTIGAGATVTADVPDGQTVVGNPAKPRDESK